MGTLGGYEITGLDLSGTEYTVEQTGQDENLRPEYVARDVTGDTIFHCTYQTYEGATRFVDNEDNEVLTVTPSGSLDIAGDYVLKDSREEETVVVLDNNVSFLQDSWRIRDPTDGSLIGTVTSGGGLVTAARKLLPVGQFIGHTFEITDAEGNAVGTIESNFAIHDRYEIEMNDRSSVPIDPIVVGTVVIDAIQGN
jgi:uncharacterized protein YxjI